MRIERGEGLKLLVGAFLVALLAVPGGVQASSHREAPLIAKDPLADNTDVYAFTSPEAGKSNRVVLISNWIPLQIADSGPNFWGFDDTCVYDIRIDNNGDALEDITYQFRFTTTRVTDHTFLYNTGVVNLDTDATLNLKQTFSVTVVKHGVATVLASGLPVAPSNVGIVSMPNYPALRNGAISTLPDGTRVFAGQRAEQFYLDLGSVFDLLLLNQGTPVNGTAGLNVHTIALEIPKNLLTADGVMPTNPALTNSIIGLWSTTQRQELSLFKPHGVARTRGPFMQVSRLANPLVNELIIDLHDKDNFNASHPHDDAQFLHYVQNPILPGLITSVLGVPTPPGPRNDLVEVFLTGVPGLNQPTNVRPAEMMRINLATPLAMTPNNLGVIGGDVQGYPNGRRPADDVVDISLKVAGGVLVSSTSFPGTGLTDGVNAPDVPFLTVFPFLADPHPGHN